MTVVLVDLDKSIASGGKRVLCCIIIVAWAAVIGNSSPDILPYFLLHNLASYGLVYPASDQLTINVSSTCIMKMSKAKQVFEKKLNSRKH